MDLTKPKKGTKRRRMTQEENAALALPKPMRERQGDFGDFVRSFTCSIAGLKGHVCGGIMTADHLNTVGSGGSDFSQVPFCWMAHMERQSSFTLRHFEDKYGVNLWEINSKLVKHYFQPSIRDTLPVRRANK